MGLTKGRQWTRIRKGFKSALSSPSAEASLANIEARESALLLLLEQCWLMKKNSSFVIYKSFENSLLNSFQVIIFERISKNCFKVNKLSKIC